MTRRSDALALALSGTVHAAAIWAALAMIAHERLPVLPFVIDLGEMVSDAPRVAPPAPAPPPTRPGQAARRVEPPRRTEPVITPSAAPVTVAATPPVSTTAGSATASEATRVAPEPVAAPTVSAPPVAAPAREKQAPTGTGSPGSTTALVSAPDAAAPLTAPSAVAVKPGPSVAALSPAPAAVLPVTRPARPRGGYQVQPTYPAEARRANAEGTTLLRVHVGADGTIDDVLVQRSAGHDALDRAAAEAVRKWRFEPARNAAGAVAVWVVVPVDFHFRLE